MVFSRFFVMSPLEEEFFTPKLPRKRWSEVDRKIRQGDSFRKLFHFHNYLNERPPVNVPVES